MATVKFYEREEKFQQSGKWAPIVELKGSGYASLRKNE